MPSLSFYLLLLIPLTAIAVPPITSATTIGVTCSTPASVSGSVLLSPERIAAKVVSMKIQAVRLPDSNPAMIGAFANTNVSLFLSVPNTLVPLLAWELSAARDWVHDHVVRFHPLTKISIISVGNDAISYSPEVAPSFLVRAMKNVRLSLEHHRISKISVSTTFSFFNIVPTAFPPSPAQFNGEVIMKPILRFLERSNSSFLINLYPYQMLETSFSIPIGFALFEKSRFNYRDDRTTSLRYHNLFDVMVDAVVSSLAVMGHKNLPVIVAETGWPSSGISASEVDATLLYSGMFLKELISHLREGYGTPLRKEGVSEVYIFEMLDKDAEEGTRNWGILNHNMTEKFSFDLLGDFSYTKFFLPIVLTNIWVIVFTAFWVLIIHVCIEASFRTRYPPRPERREWNETPRII